MPDEHHFIRDVIEAHYWYCLGTYRAIDSPEVQATGANCLKRIPRDPAIARPPHLNIVLREIHQTKENLTVVIIGDLRVLYVTGLELYGRAKTIVVQPPKPHGIRGTVRITGEAQVDISPAEVDRAEIARPPGYVYPWLINFELIAAPGRNDGWWIPGLTGIIGCPHRDGRRPV